MSEQEYKELRKSINGLRIKNAESIKDKAYNAGIESAIRCLEGSYKADECYRTRDYSPRYLYEGPEESYV